MRIPVTMVGLVLAVSCSAHAADPLGVTGGLGGTTGVTGGLGAGNGLGGAGRLGTGLGAGGGLGAGLGRAANLGAGSGLGVAGGLNTTGGLGVNGNLGATGGLNLQVPGRAGANLGARTAGSVEANLPGADISAGQQGSGQLRARDRRLMRPESRSNAGEQTNEPQQTSRGAAFDARQSGQTHLSLQAESVLHSRLSQIDRMRDQALVSGDVELLTRADALESQVRFEHRQWIERNAPRGPAIEPSAVRDANANVNSSAYVQGAAQGAARTQDIANGEQLEMRGNGLIRASGEVNQAGQFGVDTAGRAVQRADVNYDPSQFGTAAEMQARQRTNAAIQTAGSTPSAFVNGRAVERAEVTYDASQFGSAAEMQARQRGDAAVQGFGAPQTGYVTGRAAGEANAAGRFNEGTGVGQYPAQLRREYPVQGPNTDARFFGNAYGQAEAFGEARNGARALPGQPQQFQGQFQGSAQGSAQGAASAGTQPSRFAPRPASPAIPTNGQVNGQGSAQGASTIQTTAPTSDKN